MLVFIGQKQPKPDHKNVRPNSASQAPRQQQTSQRPQTALPQGQQQRKDRKDRNQQREKARPNQSAEPRVAHEDQQNSNQSFRNPRRSNQRRQPQRNSKSETSNEKNEVPNNEAACSSLNSGEAQHQAKPEKDKQSQNNSEKVMSQQSQTVKEHAQSGNRNRSLQEQREGGDDRPRNRNRRRWGRKGAPEGHSGASNRDHFKGGAGENNENGPNKRGPLEKEEVKTAVSEEGGHEIEKNSNKENGPVGSTIKQEDPAMNGHKTDVSSNSVDCLNGENAHVPEKEGGVDKEALPQRPDRPSRRRGTQRDRKDGPRPGPAPERHLNGTKPVENGTGDYHSKEESTSQSKMQTSAEGAQNPRETKIEDHAKQELDSKLDKTLPPRVNGYIPMKEIHEVSIGR